MLMNLPLNETVRQKINTYKKKFYEYLRTEKGQLDVVERNKRLDVLRSVLNKAALEKFDETSVATLANNLWAFGWWSNKKYIVDYFIKGAGGVDKLAKTLSELLYSDEELATRYDKFRKNVSGMGGRHNRNSKRCKSHRIRNMEQEGKIRHHKVRVGRNPSSTQHQHYG